MRFILIKNGRRTLKPLPINNADDLIETIDTHPMIISDDRAFTVDVLTTARKTASQ